MVNQADRWNVGVKDFLKSKESRKTTPPETASKRVEDYHKPALLYRKRLNFTIAMISQFGSITS